MCNNFLLKHFPKYPEYSKETSLFNKLKEDIEINYFKKA